MGVKPLNLFSRGCKFFFQGLPPGIVPDDASYKVIEGVGLSQDNELRVGEGECNGLGPLSGWGFRWVS